MPMRKTVWLALFFLPVLLFISLPFSRAATQENYREKKIFYDSLSIVLNKYIVPVGNWSLFSGTLQGLQKLTGADTFRLKTTGNLTEVSIKDHPPIMFFRDQIDNNAIELVESVSKVLDGVFDQYGGLDKIDIIHGAIAGMVATLDPNSYFIGPEEFRRTREQNRGFYDGVGLELTIRDNMVTVVSPIADSPADRTGIKPNDRITAVDAISTEGMGIMKVTEMIRGDEGQPVTLTVDRQGWDQPKDIVLTREAIPHRTVKSSLLEPGFGYIRVTDFLGTTADDFSAALTGLIGESELYGLVIDLRNNPGGLLNQALELTDFFLNNGVIATTEGRIKSDNRTFYARPTTLPNDYPIVILINGGSASGSEIFASSLRSHKRAMLVGERSFGKGIIQATYPIQTGGALRLTTARILTPDGDEIQGVGVTPDLHVALSPATVKENSAEKPATSADQDGTNTGEDPAVRIGLDILKRSLLLQEAPERGQAQDAAGEPFAVRKRFIGLTRAIEEMNL